MTRILPTAKLLANGDIQLKLTGEFVTLEVDLHPEDANFAMNQLARALRDRDGTWPQLDTTQPVVPTTRRATRRR